VGRHANPHIRIRAVTKVTSLPDSLDIHVADNETILEAALRSGVPLAHAIDPREDGTPPGFEIVGDVSKNKSNLIVCDRRIHAGYLWLALE